MKRIGFMVGAGLAAALVVAGHAPAQAGHVHAVQTADSPASGQPIDGGGTWILNRPDAYYIGRLTPGQTFGDEATTDSNWHWGRAVGSVQMCGWVMPGSLGASAGEAGDSCSAAAMKQLAHRSYIGRDYNAPAHAATDGSVVPAAAGCAMTYNYYYGSGFGSNGGHPADPAGGIQATVKYRYTTVDGAQAVVRDSLLGWGFVPVGCVQRPATLYNDDDVD